MNLKRATFAAACLAMLVTRLMANGDRPNFVIILADDLRYGSLGSSGNRTVVTPNLDRFAKEGARFTHNFVTLSVCSPSRAAYLTGKYGSNNGVTTLGHGVGLNQGLRTIAHALRDAGYQTVNFGKWHLANTLEEAGFTDYLYFFDNGAYTGREVMRKDGPPIPVPGHIDEFMATETIKFLDARAGANDRPFMLIWNLQLPHFAMHENDSVSWDPRPAALANYRDGSVPLPATWGAGLIGKPPYLATGRSHLKATAELGWDKPAKMISSLRDYYAVITDMDTEVGRVLDAIKRSSLARNTYVFFVSDNGYLVGEFQLVSKVLPYEPSIRLPMLVNGPGVAPSVVEDLVLNIDLAPTLAELAGIKDSLQPDGRSYAAALRGEKLSDWRTSFLYEAPTQTLGVLPHFAVRTKRWKYIEQFDNQQLKTPIYRELYDLSSDPEERVNLSELPEYKEVEQQLSVELNRLRQAPTHH